MKRTFSISGALIWNSIPLSIKPTNGQSGVQFSLRNDVTEHKSLLKLIYTDESKMANIVHLAIFIYVVSWKWKMTL